MGRQFAALKHFAHDVATAQELTLDLELRDRRPIGVILDALTDAFVIKNVHAFIGNAKMIEDLHDLA